MAGPEGTPTPLYDREAEGVLRQTRQRSRDNGGRDQSDRAVSQAVPGAGRSRTSEGMASALEPPGGTSMALSTP